MIVSRYNFNTSIADKQMYIYQFAYFWMKIFFSLFYLTFNFTIFICYFWSKSNHTVKV